MLNGMTPAHVPNLVASVIPGGPPRDSATTPTGNFRVGSEGRRSMASRPRNSLVIDNPMGYVGSGWTRSIRYRTTLVRLYRLRYSCMLEPDRLVGDVVYISVVVEAWCH